VQGLPCGINTLYYTKWQENLFEDMTIDLFNNPVGCLTSLAIFQAKALQNCGF
jgi:hypothetical protein